MFILGFGIKQLNKLWFTKCHVSWNVFQPIEPIEPIEPSNFIRHICTCGQFGILLRGGGARGNYIARSAKNLPPP